jgi:hypothetical protein
VTIPVAVRCPVRPRRPSRTVSPLADAGHRGGNTPGPTVPYWIRQRARSPRGRPEPGQCDSRRHLFCYDAWLTSSSSSSSARFPSVRLRSRALLSQSRTPTEPRRSVGFFRSGRLASRLAWLITQSTSEWLVSHHRSCRWFRGYRRAMAHGPGTSTPARRIEVVQGDSRSAMNHRRDGETNRASGESKGHNHRSILFVWA